MKWLVSLGVILVLLLGAAVVAPNFIDWNQYKSTAEKQATELTGLELKVGGDVSLALLPSPRVYLEKVSLKNPAQSDPFASVDTLEVRVDLMPLLQKQVKINAVYLVKPDIKLAKDAQGSFNFMTPKLQAMIGAPKDDKKAAASKPQDISLDDLNIEDGAFSYKDAAQKTDINLSAINVQMSAASLQGPFAGEGSLQYGAMPVSFQVKTGEIKDPAGPTTLNLKAEVEGVHVEYAGALTLGEAPEVQGEAAVKINALADLKALQSMKGQIPSGGLSLEGLLSANAKAVSMKNAQLVLGGQALKGQFEAGLEPLTLNAAFTGNAPLNMDDYIPSSQSGNNAGLSAAALSKMLPQTLELPKTGSINLALNVPALMFQGQSFKTASLKIGKADKGFDLDFRAGEMPGKGPLQITASLAYAEKSTSAKTGMDIYSGPSLNLKIKGETQNLPQTVQAFTGMKDLPLVKDSKRGVFDLGAQLGGSGLTINKSVINIDEAAYAVSGSLKSQGGSPRDLLSVALTADDMDFDALSGGSNAQQPVGGDPLSPLKNLSLPYDVNADLSVNKAKLQGYNIEGLKAVVKIRPNAMVLDNISARNFAGASFNMSGNLPNLKQMSGLDLNVKGSAADPYALAKALKIDASAWPKGMKNVGLNAKASGDLSALNVNATIEALEAQVNVKGKVADPLTKLSMNNLALQIKHPNLNRALRQFAPGAPDYGSLSGPLDFYSDVSMSGQSIALNNIKANLAGASVNGSLNMDTSGAKPYIKGDLKLGRLVLQGTKGGAAASGGAGKWSKEPLGADWLHDMNIDFNVSADSILYENWDLSKPALNMSLKNGILNVTDLKAGLYDGSIQASGTLASKAKGQPVSLDGKAAIQSVNMEPLVKSFTGNRLLKGKGDINLNTTIQGTGSSMASLIGSLAGQGTISGSDIVLEGIDVTRFARALSDTSKPGDSLLHLWKGVATGGSTEFTTLDGAYVINNGVINFQKLLLDGPRAAIDTTGNISLPAWRIKTAHKMSVKDRDDVPPFTINVEGPLDNPAQTFGEGAINNYLQQKVNKKLEKLIGDKLGIPGLGGGAAPQDTAPANDNTQPEQQLQDTQLQEPAPQDAAPQDPKDVLEDAAKDAVKDVLKGFLR